MIIKINGFNPIVAESVTPYSTAARTQVLDITVNLAAASLGGRFFYVYTALDAGVIGVWFNVDAGNTAPRMINSTEIMEVALLGTDTTANVATKLATALGAHADINGVATTATGSVVTVTYAGTGSVSTPINGFGTTQLITNAVSASMDFVVTTSGKPITTGMTNMFTIVGRISDNSNQNQQTENQRLFKTRPITITCPYQVINFITEP